MGTFLIPISDLAAYSGNKDAHNSLDSESNEQEKNFET